MPPQFDTTRRHATPTRSWHAVVPMLVFVVSVAGLNVALNSVVAVLGPALPPSLRFEYAISVPFTPAAAVGALLVATVASVVSLAFVVRALGAPDRPAGAVSMSGETVRRIARAIAVVLAAAVVVPVGLALFVVPGLVGLTYLPVVFISVVRDGQTVAGAVKSSHECILSAPAPVAATALGMVALLCGIGVAGLVTAVLPPAVEFVVGGLGCALVALAGMARLTKLSERASAQRATTAEGRL